jgi:PKD repeat protein
MQSAAFSHTIFIFLMTILIVMPFSTSSATQIIVAIDSSSLMYRPLSNRDARTPIRSIQESLIPYIQALPKESRLRLISFDERIKINQEFHLVQASTYEEAIKTLFAITRASPNTDKVNLLTAIETALEQATAYTLAIPNEIVSIRIYTYAGSTDTPLLIDSILKKFPLVNGKNIRAHLYTLGPQPIEIPLYEGFETSHHPMLRDLVPPIISWKPHPIRTGETITFTENSNTTYRSYRWLINDIPAGDQRTITRQFDQSGVYTLTLIVQSLSGEEILVKENIQVIVGKLEVTFTHSPTRIQEGQPVTFTPKSNAPYKELTWLINNIPTSNANELRTKFDTLGEQQITLEAKDEYGNVSTHSLTIQVENHYIQPQAQLHTPVLKGTAPLTLTLGATITGDFSKLTWDLGDGRISTETFTEHTYRHPGKYTYKLTIIPEDPTHQKVEMTGTIEVTRDWSWLLLLLPIIITLSIPFLLLIRFSPPIDGILSGKKTIDLATYKTKGKIMLPLSTIESESDGYIKFHFKGKKYAPEAKAAFTHTLCCVNGHRYLPGEYFPLRRRTTIQLANREVLVYTNSRLDHDVA